MIINIILVNKIDIISNLKEIIMLYFKIIFLLFIKKEFFFYYSK